MDVKREIGVLAVGKILLRQKFDHRISYHSLTTGPMLIEVGFKVR